MLGVCKKCDSQEWTGILEQTKELCADCAIKKENRMTSRQLKDKACDMEEEYEEYVAARKSADLSYMDIWTWLVEQEMTEQEYRNNAAIDDAITEGDNDVK